VGGADVVAGSQGGEPLDVDAQHLGEQVGLGLAQLGVEGGDVADGAVALAQLDRGGPCLLYTTDAADE